MTSASPMVWRWKSIAFDEALGQLRVDGEAVRVERIPLRVLQTLLRAPQSAATADDLLNAVWHRPRDAISRNALSNAIGKLRRALGAEGDGLIAALPQGGYRLTGRWTAESSAPPASAMEGVRAGSPVPHVPGWRLVTPLQQNLETAVWRAVDAEDRPAVVKFAWGSVGAQRSLMTELRIARSLEEAFGETAEFLPVWIEQFAEAPFCLAGPWRGDDMAAWAQARGGLASIPLEERLAVVAALAAAMARAHGVGVLHADLKPENVLVPGPGTVCVIDFGSGRHPASVDLSEDPGAAHRTSLGESQRRTLLYLAPERLAGRPATVASDVFAVGVILYQCVVGDHERPIAPGWERDVEDELLRADIAAATLRDPAERLPSLDDLARRLRALPSRRAEHAAQRRQAEEQAALARAMSLARARRPWVAATLALFALGAAFSLYFARQAAEDRDEARAQYLRAQSINDYLAVGFLQAANPALGGDPSITLRDAMRRAGDRLDAGLQAAPTTAAAMHQAIGNYFLALRQFDDALPHFRRAVDIDRAVLGPDADATIGAQCDFGAATLLAGEKEAARRLMEHPRALLDRHLGLADATRCKCHQVLGRLASSDGLNAQASEQFRIMSELADRNPSSTARQRGLARAVYGESQVRLGEVDAGIALLRAVVRDFERQFGGEQFDTLSAREMLADALASAGAVDEARQIYDGLIAAYRQQIAPSSPLVRQLEAARAGLPQP